MNAFLLNHSEICSHLHQGNLENAITVFLDKTKEVMFTPFSRNTYLSSLNFSIYNYFLLKENISLHECCMENEKRIAQAASDSVSYVGVQIITSYNYDQNHLFEKYPNVHVRSALYYIHQNLDGPLTLQTVSSAVNVNPSYLCQLFRREVGTGFSDYILAQRISLGTNLLRSTDYPIQEIAVRCGFKSTSYFSTCYKKATGKLPSEDRN